MLTSFEALILLSIQRLRDNAFTVPLRHELEESLKEFVSVGRLFVALNSLEDRGFLSSSYEPGGPERKYRPRRFCKLEDSGHAALLEHKQRWIDDISRALNTKEREA